MHTEKNVAESLFLTILNIPDKMKDNVKARADQQRICDRPRLNMKPPTGGRKNWFKPDADFVLKPPEKKEGLIWLKQWGTCIIRAASCRGGYANSLGPYAFGSRC